MTVSPGLVSRLQSRDALALDEFHRTHRLRILTLASGLLDDDGDAEEVLFEVVWAVHQKVHAFSGDQAALERWSDDLTREACERIARRARRSGAMSAPAVPQIDRQHASW